MIEHLILILIEAMASRDRAEQQAALHTAVADLEQLRTNPAVALAAGDVVIPAARRGSMSVLLALLIGLAAGAVMVAAFFLSRRFVHIPIHLFPIISLATLGGAAVMTI